MADLPVRHLHTLVCLAETGSFRRAAERLKLSQPAVSSHIRDLEGHFGVALVHRTTRRVSLTAEGEALAARARRAFQELEMASQDLRDLGRSSSRPGRGGVHSAHDDQDHPRGGAASGGRLSRGGNRDPRRALEPD